MSEVKKKQIPPRRLTTEEAREIGRKGGKASVVARNKKKSLREALEALLSSNYKRDGQTLSGYDELALGIYAKAKMGDVAAFNSIRDLIGEKPKETLALESDVVQAIKIKFVDKSNKNTKKEVDPKIVGDYTPPTNTEE